MAEIVLVRQQHRELTDAEKGVVRTALFGMIDGLGERGKKQWRRLWNGLMSLEPGEMVTIKTNKPRSGPFHRRHMLIEQRVFESQERIESFRAFRDWLKVSIGFVDWHAGAKGGVFPVPKSISWDELEEDEFKQVHDEFMNFLRGPHACKYLWPRMRDIDRDAAMDALLSEFNE